MSIEARITSGVPLLSELKFLLYGPPKIGKSLQASGFPDALFLATEYRHEHIKANVINMECWEDFVDIVKYLGKKQYKLLKLNKPPKTIIIDVVETLYDFCRNYICDKLEIDHVSEGKWGRAYDQIDMEFEQTLNRLFLLNVIHILISHTENKEINNKLGVIHKTVPSLQKRARTIVMPKVSVIGYMDVESVKVDDKKYIEQRVISFAPSEILEVGDGLGILPEKIITNKDKLSGLHEQFKLAYDKQ